MEYLLLIPAALSGFFWGYIIGNIKGSNKVYKDVLSEREKTEFIKDAYCQLLKLLDKKP